MGSPYQNVARRFIARACRHVARALKLEDWNLEGLTQARPVTLYHGTTKSFHTFDPSKSRSELVDKYYGAGVFLTPSKRVAEKYAEANRNIGFEPTLIDDLKTKNAPAAVFLQALYTRGDAAWDLWTPETLGVAPGDDYMEALTKLTGGIDPNTLADVGRWILGSKVKSMMQEDDTLSLFSQSTGMPDWVYGQLAEIGLDADKYRPKVYTVTVTVSNTLVTANRAQARSAKRKGYECVVYYGTDLVDGVPEVAVFNPHKVKIGHVEVI